MKALMVHGAEWGAVGDRLFNVFGEEMSEKQVQGVLRRWMGYGVPDFSLAKDCTEQRATALGYGTLDADQAHVFAFPLPPSLGSQRVLRRLRVTLGWMSPIAPNSQKYRKAALWYKVNNRPFVDSRPPMSKDWQAVRRGTIQHEVFEGESAVPISENEALTIKVNCRADAGRLAGPINYGLAVTLEIATGLDIDIYEDVRANIAVPVEVRQAAADIDDDEAGEL